MSSDHPSLDNRRLKIEILQTFFQHINKRDIDNLMRSLHDNVELTLYDNAAAEYTKTSCKEQVKKYFEALFARNIEAHIDVHKIFGFFFVGN
ncbi:MAG: nuclear transport factor 2 family protein [Candidatus Heimdallarchaeota archaeon]|nr:nuclear transport factor 2 family protein [Candidatus Heimdallarchaeota archaeon]